MSTLFPLKCIVLKNRTVCLLNLDTELIEDEKIFTSVDKIVESNDYEQVAFLSNHLLVVIDRMFNIRKYGGACWGSGISIRSFQGDEFVIYNFATSLTFQYRIVGEKLVKIVEGLNVGVLIHTFPNGSMVIGWGEDKKFINSSGQEVKVDDCDPTKLHVLKTIKGSHSRKFFGDKVIYTKYNRYQNPREMNFYTYRVAEDATVTHEKTHRLLLGKDGFDESLLPWIAIFPDDSPLLIGGTLHYFSTQKILFYRDSNCINREVNVDIDRYSLIYPLKCLQTDLDEGTVEITKSLPRAIFKDLINVIIGYLLF